MKVWILGKRGFVGQHLGALCRQRGIDLISTSQEEVDITDFEAMQAFVEKMQPSHIVNCAAYTDVDRAESAPERAFAINSEGPKYLAKIAALHRLKMVHLSTDYLFDGTKNTPYDETDLPHPINQYGKSKWLGEEHVLTLLPTACIVRTSWVFGRGGKTFISSLIALLQEKEELKVVADQVSRPTYCEDLVEVLLRLLDVSGTFHFANASPSSRFTMAQKVQLLLEKHRIPMACKALIPIAAESVVGMAPRPLYTVLSTEKIERELGVTPRSWEEGMEKMVTAYAY